MSIQIFFFNILSSTQYSKSKEFKMQVSIKPEFESVLMVDIQQFAYLHIITTSSENTLS